MEARHCGVLVDQRGGQDGAVSARVVRDGVDRDRAREPGRRDREQREDHEAGGARDQAIDEQVIEADAAQLAIPKQVAVEPITITPTVE